MGIAERVFWEGGKDLEGRNWGVLGRFWRKTMGVSSKPGTGRTNLHPTRFYCVLGRHWTQNLNPDANFQIASFSFYRFEVETTIGQERRHEVGLKHDQVR